MLTQGRTIRMSFYTADSSLLVSVDRDLAGRFGGATRHLAVRFVGDDTRDGACVMMVV